MKLFLNLLLFILTNNNYCFDNEGFKKPNDILNHKNNYKKREQKSLNKTEEDNAYNNDAIIELKKKNIINTVTLQTVVNIQNIFQEKFCYCIPQENCLYEIYRLFIKNDILKEPNLFISNMFYNHLMIFIKNIPCFKNITFDKKDFDKKIVFSIKNDFCNQTIMFHKVYDIITILFIKLFNTTMEINNITTITDNKKILKFFSNSIIRCISYALYETIIESLHYCYIFNKKSKQKLYEYYIKKWHEIR